MTSHTLGHENRETDDEKFLDATVRTETSCQQRICLTHTYPHVGAQRLCLIHTYIADLLCDTSQRNWVTKKPSSADLR